MGRTLLPTPAGPLRVLGKGHASVVLAVYSDSWGLAAAKVLRSDSKRSSLEGEASLLEEASRHGASPRVYYWSPRVIVMQLVRGPALGEALSSYACEWRIIQESLRAAYALDTAGILHLELSRAHSHIMFTGDPCISRALVIDLESAVRGDCGSVVKLAGYFARLLGPPPEALRRLLRLYSRSGCQSTLLELILEEIHKILSKKHK